MVKAVAVTPLISPHEMVRESVDCEAVTLSPDNYNNNHIFSVVNL